jgi:hypothetical protein
MHEPGESLITTGHRLVRIDNESMLTRGGADLRQSPWLATSAGMDLAERLCREILVLPDAVFEDALRIPPKVTGTREFRTHVRQVRPRAQAFLNQSS